MLQTKTLIDWIAIAAIALLCTGCDSQSQPSAQPTGGVAEGSQSDPATLADAQKAFEAGDVESAERIAQQVLIGDPSNLDAGLMLVAAAANRADGETAAELLIQLATSHPKQSPLLRAQAAEFLYESGQPIRAIDVLQSVVDEHPDQLPIRRRLAGALNARGLRFDANEHLRFLAGRMMLSPRELIGLINPLLTWETFSEKPDLEDTELIARVGVLNVVAALRAGGDVREALALLSGSGMLGDRHPAAVAMHGWLLSINQEFEQLEAWAVNADPRTQRYPAYWLGLGNLMLHRGSDAAVGCFVEAIRREPNAMEALMGLAQALDTVDESELEASVIERQEMVNATQSLVYKFGTGEVADPAIGREFGRLLNALGRPIESLAWQESLIAMVAPSAPQLTVLRNHKARVLEQMPSGRDIQKVTCGIQPGQFGDLAMELAQLRSEQGTRDGDDAASPALVFSPSPPSFANVADDLGIDVTHRNAPTPIDKEFRLFEALGSGVACLDFDLDGRVDLYLGQAGGDPPDRPSEQVNRLVRHQADRYLDVTIASGAGDVGYTHGVTAGDWNQDGFPDLVVGNAGVNRLMINQGDGTYRVETDRTESANEGRLPREWADPQLTMSLAVADVTGDFLPDLFEVNYVNDPRVYDPVEYGTDGKPVVLPGPKQFVAAPARLFAASPDGGARLETLGPADEISSTGLGVLVTDLDGERGNEIFVANDQNPNHLWKRQLSGGQTTWVEIAVARGCAYGTGGKPFACMGIAAADFDRSGTLDLHITNFNGECSNLFLQDASGNFSDRALTFGLDEPTTVMVGFGTQAVDYENNGSVDLVVVNGHIEDFRDKGKPFRMPTQILASDGSGFIAQEVQGDPGYWSGLRLGRAVAKLDWNRDGKMDFVSSELNGPVALMENRTQPAGHFLQLELVGTATERDAIGAKVTIESGGNTAVQWVQTGDGYLCRNEAVLAWGLGETSVVDRITVDWPSGRKQRFERIAVDQRILVVEGQVEAWSR